MSDFADHKSNFEAKVKEILDNMWQNMNDKLEHFGLKKVSYTISQYQHCHVSYLFDGTDLLLYLACVFDSSVPTLYCIREHGCAGPISRRRSWVQNGSFLCVALESFAFCMFIKAQQLYN